MTATVIVHGPNRARVFVDGGEISMTGKLFVVEIGTHIFGLTDDVSCPPSVKVLVSAEAAPMEIEL